ncbi:hypothetical protein HZC07_01455, partial [Candidatus Micrarchaeota archaeon]|nr:hypothetical protein [Candidatus Micrarchaeota archaeon]
VETRVTKDILSETRKFNLFAYLSCQYLGQLSKEVLDSVVSNSRNIIAFKINKQDAALLSSIMEIKVEEYFKKHRATTELEESKREMFVRLHQRECIVRLFDGTKYLLPMKLKITDAAKWGLHEGRIYDDRADAPPSSGTRVPGEYEGREQETRDEQKEEGTPLRYRELENNQNSQFQAQKEEKPPEKSSEPVEQKAEKPDLPDPMTEAHILRETPDAIYQLEKVQLAAEKNKTHAVPSEHSSSTSPPVSLPSESRPAVSEKPVSNKKPNSKTKKSKKKG